MCLKNLWKSNYRLQNVLRCIMTQRPQTCSGLKRFRENTFQLIHKKKQ